MKLGSAYFRHSLIKLSIVSVAVLFILWDFFTSRDTKSEPGAIYLIIFIWVGGTAFLICQLIRAKRLEREAALAQIGEDGPANGSQSFTSETNSTSSAAGSRR